MISPSAFLSSDLSGATAGYLDIGLAAGLVMSALETIQPGSFQPLEMANFGDSSVLASARLFSAINYYAFVCLTTVGFGDISPMLPLSRMVSVATSVAGPLYLAAVMGGLIGRFASSLDRQSRERRAQLPLRQPSNQSLPKGSLRCHCPRHT